MSVVLKCIKEKSKLRVRIVTAGYLTTANCQFPKAIRQEGCYYEVPVENVTLITRTQKWYYSIKKNIKILDNYQQQYEKVILEQIKIYEDKDETECCICLTNDKKVVFVPCGHYHCCDECSGKVDKCPICRSQISQKIDKSKFG